MCSSAIMAFPSCWPQTAGSAGGTEAKYGDSNRCLFVSFGFVVNNEHLDDRDPGGWKQHRLQQRVALLAALDIGGLMTEGGTGLSRGANPFQYNESEHCPCLHALLQTIL